ncbi:MAG: glycoside hydrolase family 2 TIM barrel-domain containing protein, partial [Lachnospiraceae bacterium]|nr:glycoside hydrolase family 2 TIM barrel-domain containing protein [Lachnospiraceae bacterium]
SLPHTYNAADGQDGGNDYYRGPAVYVRTLRTSGESKNKEFYLECLGAAMTAEVFLNGTRLSRHEGGFSTFRVRLTEALRPTGCDNLLAIRVDNSENDRVYPQKADFTFYGGLYRDVNLITVPQAHFALIPDGTPGIHVISEVDLAHLSAAVQVDVQTEGVADGETVELRIFGADDEDSQHAGGAACQTVRAAVRDNHARGSFHLDPVRLWDGLADPYLYTAEAVLISEGEAGDEESVLDAVGTRFGVRSFRVDPEKGFFLNGRPYPLRGVSRHQDRLGVGNAITPAMMEEDMAVIRDIGANSLRLAHYQQAQAFYDLCDENGILVWAEIPFITKFMEKGIQNTLGQMRELITQSSNHPSIYCWGLSNEITASSSVTEELMENHRMLQKLCHEMDPTRPTVMAHAFMLEKDSPLIGIADLGCYNLYFGWYLGELDQNDSFLDEYHSLYPERAIGLAEYGADANIQFHAEHPAQGDYSEEFQCVYHEHMVRMIQDRPYLWTTYVWNLFDFAADGRDEGGKKGQNQKGLVEFDHKTRKDAFYLYKAIWSREPFVHLCGKRFVNRAGETTRVRVYTNQERVTLYDGTQIVARKERQDAAQPGVFLFDVPLHGEMYLSVVADSGGQTVRDEMTLRQVPEPDPSYQFGGAGAVVNWFDKITIDPAYYSIRDTLGELQKNPGTKTIVDRMMQRAAASRGDVAKSTAGNRALQQMMAGMTLESLLKKAGSNVISPEMMQTINEALQKVKK